ncbi:fasciclin domain-containing protein [Erythrobacter arachoides]|uniref:Fasciclin domain-containing protein n=1 Tax=Aurantiacibacter arachoides TaxID=1850444 RepID=A0A844ZZD5_9SPHN|nr:fasciclin domain-containing protein [Aurantiacibacter arachoides]MXO93543.1 fasciclin domain-containing protein [Aurantiacibacter arachoides]GGD48549.1 fasciclin [Aurantiacibacter arachoides]
MKKFVFPIVAALGLTAAGCTTMDGGMGGDVAYVDGAAMYANRTIVANAANSPIHTTLVQAVTAAGLVDTLNSAGPFTVFAPTDEAFGRVPAATRSSLMMPANRAMLTSVLTYHVVPGRITAADIMAAIRAGNGTATYTTVQGNPLTFRMNNGNVMIMGQGGSSAYVTQADVMQSNGVIHVVNGVLTPSM